MTDVNIQILLFPLRGENPMPYIVFLGRPILFLPQETPQTTTTKPKTNQPTKTPKPVRILSI